ncbi:MAG: hypothetical protein AB1640_25690 [bacterium]
MKCLKYAPLLSRYMDDDLAASETDDVVVHVSSCLHCREELEALYRLRAWLHAADAGNEVLQFVRFRDLRFDFDRAEPFGSTNPEAGTEESEDSRHPRGPSKWNLQEDKTRKPPGKIGLLRKRPAWKWMPFQAPAAVWRLALPLLVLAAIVVLWRQDDWMKIARDRKVDVGELQVIADSRLPAPAKDQDAGELELYLYEHASQQPWARYGDELPMIQLASDPNP